MSPQDPATFVPPELLQTIADTVEAQQTQTRTAETASPTELTTAAPSAATLPSRTASAVNSISATSTSASTSASTSSTLSRTSSSTSSSISPSSPRSSSSHTSSTSTSLRTSALTTGGGASSTSKSSIAGPVAGTLLAVFAVGCAFAFYWFCYRKNKRPSSRRRASGVGGWKPFSAGGTREMYTDEPEVETRDVTEAGGIGRRSDERGRSHSRGRSSVDTVNSEYLLSTISHTSTFNPTLPHQHTTADPSSTSHRATDSQSSRPQPSPTSPTQPTRSTSFSFLRKTASPLTGLIASLFPGGGSGSRSPSSPQGLSREPSFRSAGLSRGSSILSPTRSSFPISPGDSVVPLLGTRESPDPTVREPSPRPVLGEVRQGRREVSQERRAEEGRRGEVHYNSG